MLTKVIAIDWVQNSWKTKLTNNIKELYSDLNIKFFPEIAREVMRDFPWSENDQDLFQEIIYHRESERVHQIRRDVALSIYDLIVVDRTSLSSWVFAMFNEDNWNATKTYPAILHRKIYDKVILFTKSIWDYKWDVKAFSDYDKWNLPELFERYIPHWFPQTVKFDNYLVNQEEVDQNIAEIILKNTTHENQ